MGTKVSKTAIGAFVLGALALLVAGVLVFGAGKLFTREHTYVTFFDGSVKGLSIGSPVTFRGVKVGQVTNISIIADPATRRLKIPVIFDLEPAKFKGTRAEFQNDPQAVESAVKELGLRTQLQMQSFVTGQLMVSIDFFPGTPANYVGLIKKYHEIPSIPTPLEQLQKTLESLPYKEIVDNLNRMLKAVDQLVSSIDARRTTRTIEAAIRDVQTLVRNVNAKVDPLADSLTRTSGAAEAALNETRETMAAARGNLQELADTTQDTLDSAQAALKQSEQTLRAYSDDSRLVIELNKTLRELSAASRSFRHLSEYLERHPESLLRGKTGAKGE
ncbi:MAG TPA: MlaD family protein [Desulfuromonadaceae bacterium]